MNLLDLQPNRISRNLEGFTAMFAGPPKIGKTTLALQFPKPIIAATEIGYKEIPGAVAQDIGSYADFKAFLNELKKPAVKDTFQTVIIDSFDNLVEYCSKYVGSQMSTEKEVYLYAEDVPFAKGRNRLLKVLNEGLQQLTHLGYSVILTTHTILRSEKTPTGKEIQKWVSSLENRPGITATSFVSNIFFIGQDDGERYLYTRETETYQAGTRYRYLANKIPLNYDALYSAIQEAITEEEKAGKGSFVTDKPIINKGSIEPEYDFTALKTEFQGLTEKIIELGESNAPRIKEIVEAELGAGKKVSALNKAQAELLYVIITNLKEEFNLQ